jgi:hypothetical protein
MKNKLLIISILCFVLACHRTSIYQPLAERFEPDYELSRFEKEIQNFEKQDAEIGIKNLQGKIVFYGSSSFRLWNNIKEDLAPLPIINHGFGGSTFPELTYYAHRMVIPYQPKTLVIYCENDPFGKKPKSPEQVFDAFGTFITLIRNQLPKTKIYFVSMKPSPSRRKQWHTTTKTNQMIENYIKKQKNMAYIDITKVMMKPDGSFNGGLFIADSLHMNTEGYRLWTSVMKPILSE